MIIKRSLKKIIDVYYKYNMDIHYENFMITEERNKLITKALQAIEEDFNYIITGDARNRFEVNKEEAYHLRQIFSQIIRRHTKSG